MRRLTLSVILRVTFGLGEAGREFREADALSETIGAYLEAIVATANEIPPLWTLNPALSSNYRKVNELLPRLRALVAEVIRERRATKGFETEDNRSNLLSVLVRDGDLIDDDIQFVLFDLIIAGSDTTASTIAAALFLLHEPRHEVMLRRMRREVADVDVLGLTLEQVRDRLPYATAVAREVLCLYPPVPFVGRTAVAGTSLGGLEVPSGGTLCFSPYDGTTSVPGGIRAFGAWGSGKGIWMAYSVAGSAAIALLKFVATLLAGKVFPRTTPSLVVEAGALRGHPVHSIFILLCGAVSIGTGASVSPEAPNGAFGTGAGEAVHRLLALLPGAKSARGFVEEYVLVGMAVAFVNIFPGLLIALALGLTGDQVNVVCVSCAASYLFVHGLGQGLLPMVVERKLLTVLSILAEHDEASGQWRAKTPASANPSDMTVNHES